MQSQKLLQTENIYHRRKSRQFNPRRLKKRPNHYSHNSRNAKQVRNLTFKPPKYTISKSVGISSVCNIVPISDGAANSKE